MTLYSDLNTPCRYVSSFEASAGTSAHQTHVYLCLASSLYH